MRDRNKMFIATTVLLGTGILAFIIAGLYAFGVLNMAHDTFAFLCWYSFITVLVGAFGFLEYELCKEMD